MFSKILPYHITWAQKNVHLGLLHCFNFSTSNVNISASNADVICGLLTCKKHWSWKYRFLVLYLNSLRPRRHKCISRSVNMYLFLFALLPALDVDCCMKFIFLLSFFVIEIFMGIEVLLSLKWNSWMKTLLNMCFEWTAKDLMRFLIQ